MSKPLKILFKYPCRGRKKLFFESLDSIVLNISDLTNYHISLTLDEDDSVLNDLEVIEKVKAYNNVSIGWGLSTSKVSAINRSMPDYDWDIVICWSNDMFATLYGFDDIIRTFIQESFPDLDGLAHFPEPDSGSALNVLYVATRKYYDRFGWIYNPEYKSLFCDNETYEIAKILGRYAFCNTNGLYIHKNPAYSEYQMDRDELFDLQQKIGYSVDFETYNRRKANNFYL